MLIFCDFYLNSVKKKPKNYMKHLKQIRVPSNTKTRPSRFTLCTYQSKPRGGGGGGGECGQGVGI